MGKRQKRSGWMNRLLSPLRKAQRVSMTEAGKLQAPMRKGKTVKKVAKKDVEKSASAPLSVRDRQKRELKTMFNIGIKDPERLAQIISRMLQEASMQDEEAQLKFERLVWEKAERRNQDSEADQESE